MMRRASRRVAISRRRRRLSVRRGGQFGLHGIGEGSLVELARVVAGLDDPVEHAVNDDAQLPGNMGHGNAREPCQQDGPVTELRGIRSDYGRMIGMGRSTKLTVAGQGWLVEDVPGPLQVPARGQCVNGP